MDKTIYLHENIKKIRISKRLSKKEFGQIFGLSARSITKYEKGEVIPSVEALIKISNYIYINIDTLLFVEMKLELSYY